MPLIDRSSHEIYYKTFGDPARPPLLFVMGLGLSSRAWQRLPGIMSERFHAIVFDNRGTGRSSQSGVAYAMSELADDAAAVIAAAGHDSAHVFGISMGGMIAQELALAQPERVRSLVLGATFASFSASRTAGLQTQLDLFLVNVGLGSAGTIIDVLVSRPWHEQHPGAALRWLKSAEPTSLRFIGAQLCAVAGHHRLGAVGNIGVPTLVVTGDADRLVPPDNSRVLAAAIPGARLLVLAGAGHCFPLEQEEATLSAVGEHCLAAERARAAARSA